MNKVYGLVTQINDNIKEIKKIHKEETKKLSRCDLIQEDLLHHIEKTNINDGFEAIEVLKMIHDNRQERREIKNELNDLGKLVKLINDNRLEARTNKLVKVINDNNNNDTYKVRVLTDVFGDYI